MRLATTATITLYGLQTIDGVAAEVGDRVLVKNQADATQNGIYTASEGDWYRAADARSPRTLQKGTTVHVQEGAANAGNTFVFNSLDPVIGQSPITLGFYLSDDTLGDAVGAASDAAASAAAALSSKNAAATSATNAAGSASAAAGSATSASSSATGAATSATNAGNSATAATGSAAGAATSAGNAASSATAASGSASAASGSAAAAAGSASSAATSAGNAATSAAAAATSVAALGYTFSTTTADADPGNGTLRLNNASAASATAAYIDNLDSGGATVSGILDGFDDSTNAIKGQLTLRSKASAAIAYVYNVTGSVVDGGGYRKLTLTYASGAGTLPTTADGIWLIFTRAGDKGADGLGSGDFIGPAASVTDNIVTFAGTTGKVGKDSGVKAADLIAGPASAVADNIATFNGTTGKLAKDSGVAVSSLAPKASPALTGTPTAPTAAAGTNSTQIATTAYVDTTFAPKASPTFTGTPAAPTAAPGTNTTQIATTGFVKVAIDVVLGGVSAAFDTLSEIAAAMLQKAADNLGMTAGFSSMVVDDGTKSSGTYTPSPLGGNYRKIINNGAFTLAAPTTANSYNIEIDITNGASAGAITFSGFATNFPKGDVLTTTSGNKFKIHISKTDAGATAVMEALQ